MDQFDTKLSEVPYIERSKRKQRMTQKEIKDFVEWAYTLDVNIFSKYSASKIRQLYKEQTNIEMSDRCICYQKNRWIFKNGKVYKVVPANFFD